MGYSAFIILLGNKEFLVQDPDGYLLRFSEDLGEKNLELEIFRYGTK